VILKRVLREQSACWTASVQSSGRRSWWLWLTSGLPCTTEQGSAVEKSGRSSTKVSSHLIFCQGLDHNGRTRNCHSWIRRRSGRSITHSPVTSVRLSWQQDISVQYEPGVGELLGPWSATKNISDLALLLSDFSSRSWCESDSKGVNSGSEACCGGRICGTFQQERGWVRAEIEVYFVNTGLEMPLILRPTCAQILLSRIPAEVWKFHVLHWPPFYGGQAPSFTEITNTHVQRYSCLPDDTVHRSIRGGWSVQFSWKFRFIFLKLLNYKKTIISPSLPFLPSTLSSSLLQDFFFSSFS
jgi:hypothetical protein